MQVDAYFSKIRYKKRKSGPGYTYVRSYLAITNTFARDPHVVGFGT
jgi:hypothetical protein